MANHGYDPRQEAYVSRHAQAEEGTSDEGEGPARWGGGVNKE